MRFINGKLKNGSELKHLPPFYMQSAPEDIELASVRKQIYIWKQAVEHGLERSIIHTESAMEIASWWKASNNSFSAFAFNGTILPSLEDDIKKEIEKTDHESSIQALKALLAYVKESIAKRGNNGQG
jgi:hypothetical protein